LLLIWLQAFLFFLDSGLSLHCLWGFFVRRFMVSFFLRPRCFFPSTFLFPGFKFSFSTALGCPFPKAPLFLFWFSFLVLPNIFHFLGSILPDLKVCYTVIGDKWFWPRVRARTLRAPVFLGSLSRQTGRDYVHACLYIHKTNVDT
jgi:hypothetical protein